jgi:arginine/lysine/ornithine decarboxylase
MSDRQLYEIIKSYTSGTVYPMHMPGHKRNSVILGTGLPYDIDLTEIYGFDNLQNPEGILKETAELASKLYGSDRAFLSVNGSTGAVLSAIYACVKPDDKIIMARNCHKAVYNAIEITGARPVYVNPELDELSGVAGSIAPLTVDKVLEQNPDAKLVVISSPTYEGVISNIKDIAEAAHKRNIPLLVDAAHGAHLGFSPMFGASPVSEGADLVVMSLHKTMPALTGCALLHIGASLLTRFRCHMP